MLIEKFIIYKYDNVFYTKEELEQIGFTYMNSKEDFLSLKLKSNYYEIITKCDICESIHDFNEYLKFDKEEMFRDKFFYDFGDRGLILGVEKYYGLRYTNGDKLEKVKIFSDEKECNDVYLKLDNEIKSIFGIFSNTVDNNESIEMLRQQKVNESKQKVLHYINNK